MFEKYLSYQMKYTEPFYVPSFSLTNKTRLACLRSSLVLIIETSTDCAEFNTRA